MIRYRWKVKKMLHFGQAHTSHQAPHATWLHLTHFTYEAETPSFAFNKLVTPVAIEFDPDLVIIFAGFDAQLILLPSKFYPLTSGVDS